MTTQQDALAAALHKQMHGDCRLRHPHRCQPCIDNAAALTASGWTLAQPAPDPLREAALAVEAFTRLLRATEDSQHDGWTMSPAWIAAENANDALRAALAAPARPDVKP